MSSPLEVEVSPVELAAGPVAVTIAHTTSPAVVRLQLGGSPVGVRVGAALTTDTEIIVIPGPQGPTGPAGGEGFTHTQASPSASWVVTHNLGRKPHTTVIVDDEVVITDVAHASDNAVNIVFASATTGIAYLS